MAIVFLPLNGIGLGHLSRCFALASQLRELGERPVIFAQGDYPPEKSDLIPGLRVGAIYQMWWPARRRLGRQIAAYARRTTPAVVIDDTHPAKIDLPDDIHRVLLLRPIVFDQLPRLRDRHGRKFRRVFIADHPDSPTWPFTEEQTRRISTWPGWECIGPIFNRPTESGIEIGRASCRERV